MFSRKDLVCVCVLALLVAPSAAQCPCWQASDGPVTCEDPTTTVMPPCVLSNVRALYLKNNLIPIVRDSFSNFPNLQNLWIENRELDFVASDAFEVPGQSMQSLVISMTSLRYFPPQLGYFIPNLQVLDLKNNKISYLPEDAFTYMRKVTDIYLQNNNLMSLTSSSFENTGVQWLYLEGNPWICDCSLWNFLQWMVSKYIRLGDNPRCSYPQQLRGILLTNFSSSQNCFAPRLQEDNA